MKIGIIDADLIGRYKVKGTFPNLACMKLSGYYKNEGHDVELLLNYDTLTKYDQVFISKVFTDTFVPDVIDRTNVRYGGTGFFWDKAENLPYEIEHHKPDYTLYEKWVEKEKSRNLERVRYEYYTDFSIGFMTRGCFRQCPFCVNKSKTKVEFHSHVSEFLDQTKRGISLWDDNILGYKNWHDVFNELIDTGKPFEFKQGMDIRLMTPEKAEVISSSRYNGDYIFAFDDIRDRDLTIEKLSLWRKHTTPKKRTKLFIFCGFDRNNVYDEDFWKQDIADTFERIKILMEFGCVPYIMRFNECDGPYRDVYQTIKTWCNFMPNYMKKSFRQYCIGQSNAGRNPEINALKKMETRHPDIVKKYFDLRREDIITDKSWR